MIAPPLPPSTALVGPQTMAFKGAALGMTLAAWQAAPSPADAAGVGPVCSGEPGAARVGLHVSPDEAQAGAKVCSYAYLGANGPTARKPVPIRAGLVAYKVRYVFEQDRLVRIGYTASADAFDDIVARIDAQVGPPTEVRRDVVKTAWGVTLPRVRMRWKSAAGWASLTDPVGEGGRMSVVYETPGLGEMPAHAETTPDVRRAHPA